MIPNKNTFCVAPWFSVFIDSRKKLSPCCKSNNTNKYNYSQLNDYFFSNELKQLRKDLINGIKNKTCSVCWETEEQNGDSLRKQYNRTLAMRFDKGSILNQINNPSVKNIKSFDLVLGNLCNLKCIMCNPGQSSQLLAEANLNPELKKWYTKNTTYNQKLFNWPEDNDFVNWCEKNLPQSIHIKFTGGEPFIIPGFHKIIEQIPDSQKKNCILHFTTNLTNINKDILNYFTKFKEVWLSVSCEGIEETLEYVRFGHKWKTLDKNFKIIQNMSSKNIILAVNYVVQTPSYHSIIAMIKYFDSLKIKIDPIMLSDPKHFHISSLTKYAKNKFIANTKNYNGFNKSFVNFIRNMSKKYIDHDKSLSEKCIKHLELLDKSRKTNYKKIIPFENLRQM